MAINSNSVSGSKSPLRSLCSSKTSNLSSCRLIKINFAGRDSCSSSRAHGPNNHKEIKSPYFTNDKVQLLSRVTAKKVINKKPSEFMSSFPLAASVYKANSDEFKLKKRATNKVKKSVLTLPNEPVPMPKTYTVSDLNDSEYFNGTNDSRANKSKKRRSMKRNKKCRVKEHTMEVRDRDARYCSQLNIDLDCSSSEIINFTGDGERMSKLSYESNNSVKASNYPHDVWAVLRNLNKFQFRPSPPASQSSVVPLRKRRPLMRKSNNNNDTHFIETCRTEEFAYISSFELDSKTRNSCSPSSSFDRVTVIDKQNEQDDIMQQFSRNIFGPNINFLDKNKIGVNDNKIQGKNKRRLKNGCKKVVHVKKIAENDKVQSNNKVTTSQLEGENVVENGKDQVLPDLNSKTSSILKLPENYSDKSSIKENDLDCYDGVNHFQKCARFGDKSYVKILSKTPNTKANVMKPIGDSEKQLNGITKVILSKGKEIVSPKFSEPQRKPRLALTLPNTNITKLSRFEIKRRLANQKFPIIILGKDQITDRGIYITNFEPPQFEGLDKQIWPFMLQWSETGNIQDKRDTIKSKTLKLKNKVSHRDDVPANVIDLSKQNIVSKKVESKKKKNITLPTINDQKQLMTEVSPDVVQKSKPLIHLKNKMFHFLHKNSSPLTFSENNWNNKYCIETVLNDKKVGTSDTTQIYNSINAKCSLTNNHFREVLVKPVENKIVQKTYSPIRHPWAKGKWASDFIENIIKKIRSGAYYGVDRKENMHRISGNEVSTQTVINASKNAYCQNSTDFELDSTPELKKDDPIKKIPGFDKTLTTLKIETLGTNKIAVKHCVTNIVVHFDIQILAESKNVNDAKKTMSYIPVGEKDNHEKIFKCNTSIINANLPAELCSIIPAMMRNILGVENKFLKPATLENVQPPSTAISEFIGRESPRLIMDCTLPSYIISDKIRPILNGHFQSAPNYNISRTQTIRPTENMDYVVTLLPIYTQVIYHYNQPSPILHVPLNTSNMSIATPNPGMSKTNNNCKALQLYEPKKFSIVPFNGFFSITDFLKQIADRFNVNGLNKKIKITCNDFTCHISNVISKTLLFPRCENQNYFPFSVPSNTVGVISLFNGFTKHSQHASEKVIHTSNTAETNAEEKTKKNIPSNENKTVLRKKGPPVKVIRKKSYLRFYRKCNSMSSISNYKSTPLNRVTNLEEFCQVLGSNLFCNVLDGCVERRILGAIEEMKNWISDITPKQALLVLLLINKKDTPNLIRFRPVLLQGIAVNRITKACELDTEIEVIEKENFHKLSQFEGISYLPASPKNQDSLLEELYWIAKTTASDYQKPFDESSEKLLKSLLEKRKKLNPSYLRVMARYVGLGLLAPTK